MKRIIAIVLLAALLLCTAACGQKRGGAETGASAPEQAAQGTPAQGTPQQGSAAQAKARIDFQSQATADLDGDGSYEMIYVDADEGVGTVSLRVEPEDGAAPAVQTVYWMNDLSRFVGVIDASLGTRQVFLVGDAGSGDYMTLVFRYENGALLCTEMAGIAKELYGDGRILMQVTLNLLGTYGADCIYARNDDDSFGPVSDYTVQTHEGFDDARALTVKRAGLSAQDAAGKAVTLEPGATLVLRATNLIDTARCATGDGADVYLPIALSDDEPPVWLIDGRPESDWFDNLQYAG